MLRSFTINLDFVQLPRRRALGAQKTNKYPLYALLPREDGEREALQRAARMLRRADAASFRWGKGGGDAPLARKLNLSPLKLRRQHLETSPSLARPNPKQDAAPKALPCSLPAPTSSTPSVKGTAAWTATGGNEVSKLSDMSALSFENWLKSGAEGAASADAAAAACTSKNVARYTVDVKSACKRIDSGAAAAENADVAENAASAAAENGGGVDYAIQYEVTYSCRAAKSGPSPAAKRANASVAPSPALSAAPAAAAPAAAAPSYSGPVKVEATLRALVSQPPLKEAADGSLVRPKPLAKETWFVEVRRGLVFSSAPLSARARSSPCFFSLPPTRALEASTSHPLQRNETNKKKGHNRDVVRRREDREEVLRSLLRRRRRRRSSPLRPQDRLHRREGGRPCRQRPRRGLWRRRRRRRRLLVVVDGERDLVCRRGAGLGARRRRRRRRPRGGRSGRGGVRLQRRLLRRGSPGRGHRHHVSGRRRGLWVQQRQRALFRRRRRERRRRL